MTKGQVIDQVTWSSDGPCDIRSCDWKSKVEKKEKVRGLNQIITMLGV